MIGLLLIALGTGGIKPCVSAFGGDQFNADQVCDTISVTLLCNRTLQYKKLILINYCFFFFCRSIYSKAIFPFSILPSIWVAFYQ